MLRLADAFLSRISEDETGIWELADEAATTIPGIDPESAFDLARASLQLLITKGYVSMRRGLAFDPNGEVLNENRARAAIEDRDAWRSPACSDGTTLMLRTTPAGERFYFSGLRFADN